MVTLTEVLATAVGAIGLWMLVAGLTEAITEVIKKVMPIKDTGTYAVSIIVGVGLAFAFGLNPFGLTGIAAYSSTVAAGLLASRGANYLSDWLKKLGIKRE
ncbi:MULTISPECIES: hypothetical protein [unclassified Paenibacillus]|uniref:hypothetical protein n=1 Tax=unclassified Paenibacillus TaxID=185978 RepID=UPI0003F989BE|nr:MULTISPECIES: hypothetical protein [unclassified Paenibacillus]KGP82417.1 hypothetical protein P364_0111955 [Paenibacillus sp. MAEPY2]KGP89291.1 hypothetical protein P363_0103030 [Paenibacillus sp. MAEPY1]